MRWSPLVLVLALGCALRPQAADTFDRQIREGTLEEAPNPSKRLLPELSVELDTKVRTWFDHNASRRLHVQLDRPMYRPGESIWLKTWNLMAKDLGPDAGYALQVELLDPQGQVVETKSIAQSAGTATSDFVLDAAAPGGKWKVRATVGEETLERDFIVAAYQAPRIDKDLEFVREAYGPGERVEALVELSQNGDALANRTVQALMQVEGETVFSEELTTDDTGAVLVAAALPSSLASGDGLLTVLVEDGGITESISRSVPIVLSEVELAFFPEGGDLVQGLPARVYFEAKDQHGEPADLEGYITDDEGRHIGTFASLHDGLGRFEMTPEKGRSYTAHITAPAGIDRTFELPAAQKKGCVLRSYDDLDSALDSTRVGVRCTTDQEVVVTGVMREETLDTAIVQAGPDREGVVYLDGERAIERKQGAMRVTVFDLGLNPLAERIVYRNRGRDLDVKITPQHDEYGPRDEVVLTVETTDPSGEPVSTELALAVVDDGVLTLADDEEGHILTRLYLDPELPESPDDPGWYFDPDEEEAARGLDLVMGTKGWRHFEWTPVMTFEPPVPSVATADTGLYLDAMGGGMRNRRPLLAKRPAMAPMAPMAPPPMMAQPGDAVAMDEMPMEMPAMEPAPLPAAKPMAPPPPPMDGPALPMGGERKVMAREERRGGRVGFGRVQQQARMPMQAVRVFPKPDYSEGFTGVRSDFRDTVLWEPTVHTDAEGKAEVRFYLSDALTQFRVTAEGVAGGYAGHGEATLRSVLPVSLDTKLPVAVSAGDRIDLPVTVTNTRPESLDVQVDSIFGSELLSAERKGGRMTVAADSSDTFWLPLVVGEGNETTSVELSVEGGGMSDTVQRELTIVPRGFPRTWSAAGELDKKARHTIVVDSDQVPGSLTATVTWHPSTVSTLIEGMEGLIREPGGCFEQTSSTNWPNVAILNYLEAHDGDPRLKLNSARQLQVGYDKLTGYQVNSGGFETFGSGPGKEVLSAFGLLQFADMAKVFPVDDRVFETDTKYLLAQRDGKGGYSNSGVSAHGFGSAPKDIHDAFITYALVATGHGDKLAKEITHQASVARTTEDPYVLALAARSLLATDHPGADKALDRLAALQAEDGSFPGAESSITHSYEANLLSESTALAALALMDGGPGNRRAVDKAAGWLVENRRGVGTWGATQATALALNALSRHAEVSARPTRGGTLIAEIGGKRVGTVHYEADQETSIEITGLEEHLVAGENTLVLRHDGGDALPYTVDVQWTSVTPDTAPDAELSVETQLDRTEVGMGETVRLHATVANETSGIVHSPIARIGLPAGLEAQTWQLEQLQERGAIAFFETRTNEVTLYWEGVHANDAYDIDLDLVAQIPGTFTGPASSAYPYYDDDDKAWDGGLKVSVTR